MLNGKSKESFQVLRNQDPRQALGQICRHNRSKLVSGTGRKIAIAGLIRGMLCAVIAFDP